MHICIDLSIHRVTYIIIKMDPEMSKNLNHLFTATNINYLAVTKSIPFLSTLFILRKITQNYQFWMHTCESQVQQPVGGK